MEPANIKKSFGDRLRRARLMRGLTLRELADKLGVLGISLSHASLQKYEKGLMGPDSSTLLALSRVFDLDPGFFFRQKHVELGSIEFRKLTKFRKRDVDRVREEAADFFEKYLQIEEILEIKAAPLPKVDLSGMAPDDEEGLAAAAEKAGEMIRSKWNLGEVPLTNVHELLEEHGVKVKIVESDEGFNGFSGWADPITPVIVLAEWLENDVPRMRLTALHELGHLVMAMPEGLTHKLKESLCYRFAGAVLIPAIALLKRIGEKRKDGISFPEKIGIKEDWGISIAAFMRRAADLKVITASQLKSFYFLNRKNRKQEPGHWQGTEKSDRFEQLVYRAVAQELITRAKAAELLDVALRQFDHLFVEQAA